MQLNSQVNSKAIGKIRARVKRELNVIKSNRYISVLCTLLFFFLIQAAAQEKRLIIVGGGDRPPAAMSRFVEWAGGQTGANILVIPWATGEPQASFEYFKKDLLPFRPKNIELAPPAPLTAETKIKFLAQLEKATGVFFTGGDQVHIMNVLEDETLLRALKQKYARGVVFSGTSAGAAIMSEVMITGEGDFTVIDGSRVQTRRGLGLLPQDMIVDQHFIKRQRQNRLFGLILGRPAALGLGIDEDTALVVTDGRRAEVIGASRVMMVKQGKEPNSLLINLVGPGEKLDLLKQMPNPKRETGANRSLVSESNNRIDPGRPQRRN